jgi:hypothetical protein
MLSRPGTPDRLFFRRNGSIRFSPHRARAPAGTRHPEAAGRAGRRSRGRPAGASEGTISLSPGRHPAGGISRRFGTPALAAGVPRNFDLNADPLCTGIPDDVEGYSLNLTATNTQGSGFILIYPRGGAQPPVSTLNYVAGQTVGQRRDRTCGYGRRRGRHRRSVGNRFDHRHQRILRGDSQRRQFLLSPGLETRRATRQRKNSAVRLPHR